MRLYQFDAQAFLSSTCNIEGFEFTALDTLPHGLSRNTQAAHGLIHREVIRGSVFGEAGAEFVCESNAPRCADSDLFSNDGAVVDGTVDGRWRHAEYGGGLPDRR